MITIRPEQPPDIPTIGEINNQAFGQPDEADLIERLRNNCPDLISLVAVQDEQVVGHILFSPVTLSGATVTVDGSGLGPLAVLPEFQNQGIGSALVEAGIARVKKRSAPFIVVLGHRSYYPRFGFRAASRLGIRCDWAVPEEAFMVLVLDEARMRGLRGIARYRPEFYP